jgi:hypothetical protein
MVGESSHFVNGHDPRMLEPAADLHFLEEPADHVSVVAKFVAQHF